ncbi:MAG: efflux RND transporter periplasmic adaptor subunit [Nitrospira sp.]|nr:efflux RND transporter periplasmic adaptor subunit [Nitrospira sp.]
MRAQGKMIVGSLFFFGLSAGLMIFLTSSPSEERTNLDRPKEQRRTIDVVSVQIRTLETTARLPGELLPYLAVDLYPKVVALLDWIGVDRGDDVQQGQILARLTAPELRAQRAEAEAKLRADQITLRHLHAAAETPGVIAVNDLEVAEKTVDAGRARVTALKEIEHYLIIAAPFDGRVIERQAHPGALLTPGQGKPLFRVEQLDRLRLVVPVPEANAGQIAEGVEVSFTVSAYPGERFTGAVRRIARSIDAKTRTMPVELDVENEKKRLAPGMFAEVEWPVRRPHATTFVPGSAVVATTEQIFVIRVSGDGTVEWVPIQRGEVMGDLQEVFGDLKPSDTVVVRGTDELRPGTTVVARLARF